MKKLAEFDNIHAHGIVGPDVITSIEPCEAGVLNTAPGQAYYSVGIHPWHAATATEATFECLGTLAADPRVVAIGECGFDKNRCDGICDAAEALVIQEKVFLEHVTLSESLGKPLVIHCVGRFGRLMELHDRLMPMQQWVVHGFAGKPELARQLAAKGIAISLGARYNQEVEDVVPRNLIYRETD